MSNGPGGAVERVPADSWGERIVERRAVLGGIAVVVLAACSGSSGKSSPGAAPGTTAPATSGLVDVTKNLAPAAHRRFTDASLQHFRAALDAKWLGAWADDRGGKGTADAVVSYDVNTHELTMTLSANGPILGTGSVPTTTYRVGVDRIALATSTLEVTSPQLGTVKIDLDARTLQATGIPGHPEIAQVTGALSRGTPTGASGSFHVIGTDGKNHVGSFTVVRGGPRPTSVAAPAAANDLTQFINGNYAASLLSPAEASQVLGRPADAPMPNGGRAFYAPNVDASDATVKSTDGTVILQYTIFRATTAAVAQDFWEHTLTAGLKPIPGMGADTAYVDNYLESYVWKDREIAQFNFAGTNSASMAPAAVARFATAIVAHLGPNG